MASPDSLYYTICKVSVVVTEFPLLNKQGRLSSIALSLVCRTGIGICLLLFLFTGNGVPPGILPLVCCGQLTGFVGPNGTSLRFPSSTSSMELILSMMFYLQVFHRWLGKEQQIIN